MTVNVMIVSPDKDARQDADWAALSAIAPEATAFVDDGRIRAAALLLDGAVLTDGVAVKSYPMDEDDQMGSLVCDFCPALLPAATLAKLRSIFAVDAAALALIDCAAERLVSVSLVGSDHLVDAHVRGCTATPGDVEINRCQGSMADMFDDLGLGRYGEGDEIPFHEFERAVASPPRHVPRLADLAAFAASARRQGAVAVYWA